jgi:hypothetical protein
MAVNLARSFLRWHRESDILFCLATDQPEVVPADVRSRVRILDVGHLKHITGFSIKLYLDELAATPHTLFIDADCLVYGRLEPVFERFKGRAVSAIGDTLQEGAFFCDVHEIIRKMSLSYLPRFVGGIYYLEKNEISRRVFEYARTLLPQYDNLGLVRLRGKENEEPLLAIAMATFGETPIEEDGSIKADRMFYTYYAANVLIGKARLWNNDNSYPANAYFRISESRPIIVHYNSNFAENFEYYAECKRLYLSVVYKLPNRLINFISKVRYELPGKSVGSLKDIARPYYRALFGIRSIKESNRSD